MTTKLDLLPGLYSILICPFASIAILLYTPSNWNQQCNVLKSIVTGNSCSILHLKSSDYKVSLFWVVSLACTSTRQNRTFSVVGLLLSIGHLWCATQFLEPFLRHSSLTLRCSCLATLGLGAPMSSPLFIYAQWMNESAKLLWHHCNKLIIHDASVNGLVW